MIVCVRGEGSVDEQKRVKLVASVVKALGWGASWIPTCW